MEINYLGQSCFKIGSKDITIVIDPFDEEKLGFKLPRLEADVVLVSHKHFDHNNVAKIKGNPVILDGQGEYEIRGNIFKGISSFHDDVQGKERGENTIFRFEVEGIKICHLGDLGQATITSEQLEEIDGVDVLLIPTGGTYTIGPKEATVIAAQIEPKIIIPMHFKSKKMAELASREDFLKEMGEESPEKLSKLKINAKDLPQETKVIVLEKV